MRLVVAELAVIAGVGCVDQTNLVAHGCGLVSLVGLAALVLRQSEENALLDQENELHIDFGLVFLLGG
jgi:hypothetical protein